MKYSIVISVSKTKFGPVVFRDNLLENITKAYQFGYDAVELAVRDPEIIDNKKLVNLLSKYSLSVPAIGTGQIYFDEGISFSDESADIRKKAVERVCKIIDLAIGLNSAVIIGLIRGNVVNPEDNFDKKLISAEKRICECMQTCMQYSENSNTLFLVEPLIRYNSNIFNTLEQVSNFLDKFKHILDINRIGILADTFHMNVEEVIIDDSLINNLNLIKYIHFSDSNRLAPGYGHIDFKKILKILIKENYESFISFEIMPIPDSETAAKVALKNTKDIEKNIKKNFT